MKIKTPWQKIVRAAARGTGLHLTADEVAVLDGDGAIQSVTESDDRADEEDKERERAEKRRAVMGAVRS